MENYNDLKEKSHNSPNPVTDEILEKINEFYETADNYTEFINKATGVFKKMLDNGLIKDYGFFMDDYGVYDSYGRNSRYVSFTWVDNNGKLHMTGVNFTQNV